MEENKETKEEVDEEKELKWKEIITAEDKIFEKTKRILKREIVKEEFELDQKQEEKLYKLVEKDIGNYLIKYEERVKLTEGESTKIEEDKIKEQFFKNCLKNSFEDLKILIKIKNAPTFDGKYVLFKGNENILMASLIENFRIFRGNKDEFEIRITKKELEELIKLYEVKDTFIDKLKKEGFLNESQYNSNNLLITFKDSGAYKNENEESIRKFILQNYNIKINKKLVNETKTLEQNLKKTQKIAVTLEKNMRNSKIETVAILGIFSGVVFNFNIMKELLFNEKAVENTFLVVTIFSGGLISTVVIFFLIKYLFLMPNEFLNTPSRKETFLKKYLFPGAIAIFSVILMIIVIFVYMTFRNDYKEQNESLKKLSQEVEIKNKEIKILKDDINNIKGKYEEQEKIFLKQKLENKKYERDVKKITDIMINQTEKKQNIDTNIKK